MLKQPNWHDLDRKLVAILRGIRPEETAEIVTILLAVGFEAIEIPLNSPEPFASIKIAAEVAKSKRPEGCFIGAGTVLTVDEVVRVQASGGNVIVSPNVNAEVISKSRELGLFSMPGVLTPTEAHSAIATGANVLKFFPASILGADGIKAIKAILPTSQEICAVGGVGPASFADYLKVGVHGFGIGSNLYQPGLTAWDVEARAKDIFAAFDKASES